MNTSGFTFRPLCQIIQDGIPGLQFGFWNNYGVSILPDSYSEQDLPFVLFARLCKDERFQNATVSVAIFKGEDFGETKDKTIDIMEKMGHKPTILDMRAAMFTKVSPEYLLKILRTVVQMEVQ